MTYLSRHGLQFNSSLLSLNLRGNGFNSKACCSYLIKNLPCTLIELDVSDNEIGDEGIRIICDNIYYRYVDEAEE